MVGQRGANSGLVFSNCFCSAFTVIQKGLSVSPCFGLRNFGRRTRHHAEDRYV